jgi:hypothetical protein
MTDAFDSLNAAQTRTKKKTKITSSFQTGSANKGGRPPKAAAEKRNSKVTVYFSTTELDGLNKYCESIGVQVAAFLRTQAMNKIKNT